MPPHAVEYPVQYLDEAVKKEISQRMTRILRHKAGKYGIPMSADAYVKVEHLLQARNLQGITSEEVIAVAESSFKRQEARFELADFEDGVYIRAMKKHSMAQVGFRLLATERATRRQQPPHTHRPDPEFVPPPPNDPPPPRVGDAARQASAEIGATVAALPPVSAWSLLPAPALEGLQGMPSGGLPPPANVRHGQVLEDFDGEGWQAQGGYLTLTEGMDITLLPSASSGELSCSAQVPNVETRSEEPMVSTTPGTAQRRWQRYAADEALTTCWWWCEADNQGFLEAEPGAWSKYADPVSNKTYWRLNDETWFWEHTGAA